MNKMTSFERRHWLDQQLKQGRLLSRQEIADKLGICIRTAQRDVQYLQDHGAPIVADRQDGGYRYTHNRFELHGQWLGEEELIGLVLAKRLATAIPDGARKAEIRRLFDKIYAHSSSSLRDLDQKISLKNICYYRVAPEIFKQVLSSLYHSVKIHISYRAAFSGQETQRTICPLHLILYRGNWHLAAYCELRQENRLFTLSRMREVRVLDDPCPIHRLDQDFHQRLENVHGIFLSDSPIPVTLRFSPAMAAYVGEQIWFPQQTITTEADGSLRITFPVGDFPEIIQEILGYGPEVEVIAPPKLRLQVIERIRSMRQVYEKNS